MADLPPRLVVAMPVHRGRISPLFEAARRLLVAELVRGRECARDEVDLGPRGLASWMAAVLGSGADLLVCGAISNSSLWHLGQHSMQVWPGVAGDVDDLIHTLAWTGTLSAAFAMPGARSVPRDRLLWQERQVLPK